MRPSTRELARAVRKEFPGLAFSRARRVEVGEDHDVIVLDEACVFRFPRNRAYQKTLAGELALLSSLPRRLPFSVPHYRWVAKNEAFGGYPLIRGAKMTRAAYGRLSPKEQARAASAIGSFLTALHGLDPSRCFGSCAREAWNPAKYCRRYVTKRRGVIRRAVSAKLLARLDAFFEAAYPETARVPKKTIVHSDLRDEHVLLDKRRGAVAGVIDFGDALLGDPAFDFLFLWDFGKRAVETAYRRYRGAKDARFLERSRLHYVRWMADELYHAIKNKDARRKAYCIAVLERELPTRRV